MKTPLQWYDVSVTMWIHESKNNDFENVLLVLKLVKSTSCPFVSSSIGRWLLYSSNVSLGVDV